jgi:hypothetical protein
MDFHEFHQVEDIEPRRLANGSDSGKKTIWRGVSSGVI